MTTEIAYNETWRKLPNGEMELVSRVEVVRPINQEPDLSGFYNALIEELGFGRANEMQRDFPAVALALDRGNWALARQGFDYALSVNGINQQEYDTIMMLLEQFHIPDPEGGM